MSQSDYQCNGQEDASYRETKIMPPYISLIGTLGINMRRGRRQSWVKFKNSAVPEHVLVL
jgi:hypothetical protein